MSQAVERNFVFTWKIKNFSCCPLSEDERLESQVFVVDSWKKRRLQLWFYPRGWGNSEPEYLSCYVRALEAENEWGNTSVESCLTLKGSDIYSIEKFKIIPTASNIGGIQELAVRDEIFQRRNIYLPNDTLTIQCHIWISDKEKTTTPEFDLGNEKILSDQILVSAARYELEELNKHLKSNHCSAVTLFKIGKKSLVWPIKGIRELGTNNRIFIPVLSTLYGDPSFLITFYLAEGEEAVEDPIANFEIRRMERDFGKRLFVECNITALNLENDTKPLMKEAHIFQKSIKEVWEFTSGIHKSELLKFLDSIDDVFHLRCEFTYSREGDVYHTENEDVVPLHCAISAETKSTDDQLKDLYDTGILSDVTLRVENRTFKAHKNILSIRSPVFRAMFETDMKENTTGFVNIDDIDPDSMDRMLTFFYSNKISIPGSNEAFELYAAANKYQVLPLKRKCVLFLLSELSVSNVCSILMLADLHQDDKLMNAAKEFVHANRSEVFVSENWKTFMEKNVKLSADIMFYVLTGAKY